MVHLEAPSSHGFIGMRHCVDRSDTKTFNDRPLGTFVPGSCGYSSRLGFAG